MIILSLGFTGIAYKRGKLFGRLCQYPITTIHCLIFTITAIPENSNWLYREALEGLAQDRDWCIKNAQQVRLTKRKAWAKARKQSDALFKDQIESYRKHYSDAYAEIQELKQENYRLRVAIKTLKEVQS